MQTRREPSKSLVSSADVMLLSTKFPSVLRFQLHEQKKEKAVRGSGIDIYGKVWACGSADWYINVVF
jgi:hypothetical protein